LRHLEQMIELAGVSKTFTTRRGAVEALCNVDLRIHDGELVCLVGPSGCGKTTVLNLIAGLERPDAGAVLMDGLPVDGPGPDRGVLFQDAALFPWLTVLDNVAFGMAMLRVPRRLRRARAARWLEQVGLLAFAEAAIHELSGGMRQRVALARALALEPRVLLMDEPFGALDVHTRRGFHDHLEEIWMKTGKTIVFITHDVAEAVRLASRVIGLGRRPARVCFSLDVPLCRPRRASDALVVEIGRGVESRIETDMHARPTRVAPEGSPSLRGPVPVDSV
jgi:NitT/TauT family transport system ATP-binding protein